MKKILTILAVALISATTLFAAVDFSGSFTTGLGFQYDENDWDLWLYGDDGEGTRESRLNLSIADDAGIWGINIVGAVENGKTDSIADFELNEAGKLGAELNLSITKLIDSAAETSITVDLSLFTTVADRVTTLRAYNNIAGNDFDRVRTDDRFTHFGLSFGYENFVAVQATWGSSFQNDDSIKFDISNQVITASALVNPLEGLKVSFDYAYNGEDRSGSDIYDEAALSTDNKHMIGVAADIDLGSMLGLDAEFGVSVSDRYQATDNYNVFAAVVYGGIKEAEAYVEYAYLNRGEAGDEASDHNLQLGLSGAINAWGYNFYFGAEDVAQFADTYYVGAEGTYTISSVTFGLGLEYAESSSYNYDGKGLWIVPSVSISF